ncbi:hypothetical protein NKH70_08270 [Mesorhizobium sp. M0991]|uniref:hypothetical protein n=1 Tax=unclassified Mesorhizobium TaxID=325217 RepID=UPI00333A9348
MVSAEAAKSLWDFDFFAPRPVSNLYGTLIHIRRSDVSGRRCDAATGSDSFVQVEKNKHQGKCTMDIVVVGIGIAFFALCFGYIKACDKL